MELANKILVEGSVMPRSKYLPTSLDALNDDYVPVERADRGSPRFSDDGSEEPGTPSPTQCRVGNIISDDGSEERKETTSVPSSTASAASAASTAATGMERRDRRRSLRVGFSEASEQNSERAMERATAQALYHKEVVRRTS